MNAWLTFATECGWELWFHHKPHWWTGEYCWVSGEGGQCVILGDEAPEGWRGETYTRHRIWPVTVRLV